MLSSSNLRLGSKLGFAVLLASALSGCNAGGAPAAPTTTSTLAPAPTNPTATDGGLYGVVTEMTSTGSTPVEGVTFGLLSCPRVNCSSGTSIYHDVTTGKEGTYRVADLYNSAANYIWIGTRQAYESAGPRPVVDLRGLRSDRGGQRRHPTRHRSSQTLTARCDSRKLRTWRTASGIFSGVSFQGYMLS